MAANILHSITYGLYVASSRSGEKVNGCILNSVMQTSAEPPTVSICINRNNLTYDYIMESGVFAISILPRDTPMKFIGNFGFQSGKEADKFAGVDYRLGRLGVPILQGNSLGYLEMKVKDSIEAETHTIIIGDLVEGERFDIDKEPLTYAYYHLVKKGKSPKNAPTYQKEEAAGGGGASPKSEGSAIVKGQDDDQAGGESEGKYRCTVCGYIYDPAEGDPENGIDPGTPFSELPADWVCPVCGAGKESFEKI